MRTHRPRCPIVLLAPVSLCLLLLCALVLTGCKTEKRAISTFQYTVDARGRKMASFPGYNYFLSPDRTRFAYFDRGEDGRYYVVVGSSEGKHYESVAKFAFSPDSKRFAYVADGNTVVVDGAEGNPYRGLATTPAGQDNPITFSADSRHVGYVALTARSMTELAKFIAVVDGVEHKPYDYILRPGYPRDGSGILFSPAGGRTAYIAGTRNNGTFLVVDGVEGKTYDGIGSVAFSADGLHISYVAQRRDASGWSDFAIVLDGKEGKWYRADEISELTFSPDGMSLVYVVRQSLGSFGVVNGVEQTTHHGVSDITFSPDSEHLAYVAVDLRQGVYEYTVILDGVPGEAYRFIGSGIQDSDGGLKFSPDSQRLAYVAVPGHLIRTLVLDGVAGRVYSRISDVTFSPDSRHIGYIADGAIAVLDNVETKYSAIAGKLILSQDALRSATVVSDSDNKAVAVDGVVGKPYYWVLAPVFSPDGRHVAYVAGNDKGQSFMVVHGIVGTAYDSVSAPVFSPDGQHIAYVAGDSKSMSYFVVVDGIEGEEYDKIMDRDEPDTPSASRASTTAIVFDSDRDFHYLALSEEKLYLVRGSPK